MLTLANAAHSVLGTSAMTSLTKGMHNVLGIPQWTPAMPKSYKRREKGEGRMEKEKNMQGNSTANFQFSTFNFQLNKVVYFPSCINQTMGFTR